MAQVNMWNGFDAGVPFGGYKTSGIGREKGEAALSHYTQVLHIHYFPHDWPWLTTSSDMVLHAPCAMAMEGHLCCAQ